MFLMFVCWRSGNDSISIGPPDADKVTGRFVGTHSNSSQKSKSINRLLKNSRFFGPCSKACSCVSFVNFWHLNQFCQLQYRLIIFVIKDTNHRSVWMAEEVWWTTFTLTCCMLVTLTRWLVSSRFRFSCLLTSYLVFPLWGWMDWSRENQGYWKSVRHGSPHSIRSTNQSTLVVLVCRDVTVVDTYFSSLERWFIDSVSRILIISSTSSDMSPNTVELSDLFAWILMGDSSKKGRLVYMWWVSLLANTNSCSWIIFLSGWLEDTYRQPKGQIQQCPLNLYFGLRPIFTASCTVKSCWLTGTVPHRPLDM